MSQDKDQFAMILLLLRLIIVSSKPTTLTKKPSLMLNPTSSSEQVLKNSLSTLFYSEKMRWTGGCVEPTNFHNTTYKLFQSFIYFQRLFLFQFFPFFLKFLLFHRKGLLRLQRCLEHT